MSNLYTNIGMFDAAYYLEKNPALVGAGLDTADAGEHYFLYGATESAAGDRVGPNNWFDIDFYKAQNPELAAAGVTDGEMLYHFAMYGAAEGRNPNAAYGDTKTIDPELYLEYALANPELAEYFGIAEDATELTAEQLAGLAVQYFNHGINEEREGGIADITPIEPETPVDVTDLDVALGNYADARAELADAEQAKEDAATQFAADNDLNPEADEDDEDPEVLEGYEEVKGKIDDEMEIASGALLETELTVIGSDGNEGVELSTFLPNDFADKSPELQDEAVAAAREVFTAQVSVAQAAVNAADKDELAAAKPLVDAAKELEFAAADVATAGDAFDGTIDGSVGDAYGFAWDDAAIGKNLVITDEAENVVIAVVNGKPTITSAGEGLEGIDKALEAAIKLFNAQKAQEAAEQKIANAAVAALKKASVELNDADGDKLSANTKFVAVEDAGTYTLSYIDKDGEIVAVNDGTDAVIGTLADGEFTYDDGDAGFSWGDGDDAGSLQSLAGQGNGNDDSAGALYADLLDAKEALAKFDEAVAEWNEVRDLQKAFNDLMDAEDDKIEAAQEALDAAIEKVEELAGDDVNFVEAVDGAAEGTAGNDLFVYTDGEELTITKFGAEGEDELYVGQGFVLVEVANRADIKANADDSVLEIFVFQEAGNTVLAIEDEVYSGSVTNSSDLTDVTLVGVNANVVDLEAGFIVLA